MKNRFATDLRANASAIGTTIMTGVVVTLLLGAAVGADAIYEEAARSGNRGEETTGMSRVVNGTHEVALSSGSLPTDESHIAVVIDGTPVEIELDWFESQGIIGDTWKVGEWVCVAGPGADCYQPPANEVTTTIYSGDANPVGLGTLSADNEASADVTYTQIDSIRLAFYIDDDGGVVVQADSQVFATVVGTEITSGGVPVPVTSQITRDGGLTWEHPWGSLPVVAGMTYDMGTVPNGAVLGAQGDASSCCYVRDSVSDDPFVYTLRNGDAVPSTAAYADQIPISALLGPFASDGLISLQENEFIVLFELGTNNLGSSAADFQDLIVIFSVAPVNLEAPAPDPTPDPTPEPEPEPAPGPKPKADPVQICHVSNSFPPSFSTQWIIGNAKLDAHLAHGDTLGPCP